jgi:hypothetical protein
MYNVLDSGWSPLGLRKPLDRQLGGLEQFDHYLFLGGRSWAMGKFISGFINGFVWWSLNVFLVFLWVFVFLWEIINEWFYGSYFVMIFKLLVSGYGWWSIYDFLAIWRWYASMVVYS